MFSPHQIGLGAFLGSAMAGAILMAMNFWKLQDARAAWISLILGVLASAAIVIVIILIPPGVKLSLGLAVGAAFYFGSKYLQGAAYENHVRRGGKQGPMWPVFGLGLLCALFIYSSVFGAGFVAGLMQGDSEAEQQLARVEVSAAGEQVYYTGAATADDAVRIADALKKFGFFDGKAAKTVFIKSEKDDAVTKSTISFVVADNAWNNDATVNYYVGMVRATARSIWQLPVKLELMDTNCQVQKELVIR